MINLKIKGLGYIGKPCSVLGLRNIELDNGVGIFPGARIDAISGKLKIGAHSKVGHNAFFDCTSNIKIGKHVTISANVFIGTGAFKASDGLNTNFKDWQIEPKEVVIEDNVFIGCGAVILPGARIKSGAVIGANVIVSGIVESGSVIKLKQQLITSQRFS